MKGVILFFIFFLIPNFLSAEINSPDIKELYQTFKKIVITPASFLEEKDKAKTEEYLKEIENLLEKVYDAHNFIKGDKEDDYNKLVILTLMKDILRLNIENLKGLLENKRGDRGYWYELHKKWYSELEYWIDKTFPSEEEK